MPFLWAGLYDKTLLDIHQSNVTLIGQGRVVITGSDEAGYMLPCVENGRTCLKKSINTTVYDVFMGGQYLLPARFPDKTFPMTSNEDWKESFIGANGTIRIHDIQQNFPELSDGYYVGIHGGFKTDQNTNLSSWYSITLPIKGIDKQGSICVNAEKASSGFLGKYGRGNGLGYIIGAKAVLDVPGEWYSDGKEVILIPPRGKNGNYELRTRLYGAVIAGNRVRLENIRFKGATALVEGDDVSFVKCLFEYISPFRHVPNVDSINKRGQSLASCWGEPGNGTAGVFVKGDRFVSKNCRFSKSWWCGMTIRGNNALVENCLFEDINWMAKRSAGLFSWGNGNLVRHCTLRNLGGAGIEGGNAAWVGQYAKDNIWEYNYIENVCQLITDQGFFYVNHQTGLKRKANSIWRYNIGKGARGPAKGNWTGPSVGYYIDNSSSGYQVYNNIVIDANEAIRYNDTEDGCKAGRDIWFYNNTFYKCDSIKYASWNKSGKSKRDAEIMLINNLAILEERLDFFERKKELRWRNNFQSQFVSVVINPEKMNFSPTTNMLKFGGIPVMGQSISYIGAVDPKRGMWRYGVDESLLPEF
ncbi:right-handed parallel beta-helix repeat-containing protein [Desulfobacter hydrogenophilus]|uniref:right-handed parallel beta-helix repeat-containing protein n=1 Tax=Desulfobacter hydrogenophilus TaxID=2291 RepID=UPI001B86B480|nr:hypothetical protein [Desulfobacter hydrogenophilus]